MLKYCLFELGNLELISIAFADHLLHDLSRVLKFHVYYSDEAHYDTLIRNPSIQLCLSFENSLGYNGDIKPRSFGAKIAWITLQIRNCVVVMTMAGMKIPNQKNPTGFEDAGMF